MPLENGPSFKAWEERQESLRASAEPQKRSIFQRLREALPEDFFGREDARLTRESRQRMQENLQKDVLGEAERGSSLRHDEEGSDSEGHILELTPEFEYKEEAPAIPEAIRPAEPQRVVREEPSVSEAGAATAAPAESLIQTLDLTEVARERAARTPEIPVPEVEPESASQGEEAAEPLSEPSETKLKKIAALDLRETEVRDADDAEVGVAATETMPSREASESPATALGNEAGEAESTETASLPEAAPLPAAAPDHLSRDSQESRAKRTGRKRQEEKNASREMRMEEAEAKLRQLISENNYAWPRVFVDRHDLRRRIRFLKADPAEGTVHFKHGDEERALHIGEFLATYTPENWLKSGVIDSAPEKETEPEAAPAPAEALPADPEAEDPFFEYEEALARARRAYAEEEYKKRSAWRTLKSMFKVEMPENDPDLEAYRNEYQDTLKRYQRARLEELASDGSREPRELGEGLEALLRYGALDEALNLRSAYDAVRLERSSLAGKALEGLKGFGRRFNSLPLKYKLPLYAAGIGLASLGGAAAVAGGSILAFRKIAATLGAAATAETIIEAGMQRRGRKRAETAVADLTDELSDEEGRFELDDSALSELEAFLDTQAESANQRIEKFRKQNFLKWAGAFGAGAVVASLSSLFSGGEAAGASDDVGLPSDQAIDNPPSPRDLPYGDIPPDAAPEDLDYGPETPEAESPEGTSIPDASAEAPASPDAATGADSAAAPTGEEVSGNTDAATPSVESTVETPAGPAPVIVSESHQAQGLWGILESRLDDDMSIAERNRSVLALERLIQEKLEGMTPDEQAAVGFRSGDINTIYAGDTLRLDQLVSSQEWQNALSGTDVPLGDSVDAGLPADTPSAETGGAVAPETPAVEQAPGLEADADPASPAVESHYSVSDSRPAAFRAEHPDLAGALKQEARDLRLSIFRTPDVSDAEFRAMSAQVDRFAEIRVDRILSHYEHLQENPAYQYSQRLNPLHLSQMGRVDALTERAETVFGEAGRVQDGERLWEYTGRIATLVMRRRLEEPDFAFRITP